MTFTDPLVVCSAEACPRSYDRIARDAAIARMQAAAMVPSVMLRFTVWQSVRTVGNAHVFAPEPTVTNAWMLEVRLIWSLDAAARERTQ